MTYVFNRRIELTLNVTSLGRRRGRRSIVVPRETLPDVFELVLAAAASPGAEVETTGIDPRVVRKLVELGLIVRPGDEAPDVHLVNPLRGLAKSDAKGATKTPSRLRPNHRVWLQTSSAPPPDLAWLQHFGAFDMTSPLLWIEDPATRFVHPISLAARDVPAIAELVATGTLPARATNLRDALWHAGALVEPAVVREARAAWTKALREARDSLRTSKYAIVRGIIPAVFRRAAQTYLRQLSKAGHLAKDGDDQEPNRHWQHNEALNRFIQFQLTSVLERVVAARVKPSFAYLSIYRPGARLKKHIDRKQCLWNMSVQLDSEPDATTRKAWPIFLEIEKEARRVDLALGDSVIYSGTDTPHWRPYLPKGWATSTVCSYHYVDRAFRGTLE